MQVNAQHHYDHPVEKTFRVFQEEALITRRLAGAGATNIHFLQHVTSGERSVIKCERTMISDIPRALQRIAGSTNVLVQTERWLTRSDGSRSCEMDIAIKGVPVTLKGTMQLLPEGDGCVNHVSIDITSSIPFLGGQLKKFTATSTKQSLADEYTTIQQLLRSI